MDAGLVVEGFDDDAHAAGTSAPADAGDLGLTGFGPLAASKASRRRRASNHQRPPTWAPEPEPEPEQLLVPPLSARGLGARKPARRAKPPAAAAAGATDGPVVTTARRRKKKEKSGGWTRSKLASAASGADGAGGAAGAGGGVARPPRVADISKLAQPPPGCAAGSDESDGEGDDVRLEAGIFDGMAGGGEPRAKATAAVVRQPFGTTATTHRRRAGVARAAGSAPRTPREIAARRDGGGGGVGSVDGVGVGGSTFATVARHPTAAMKPPRCEPAAAGFTALSDAQLSVLKEIFRSVDCGSKGWLGHDDVRELVHVLDTADQERRQGSGGGGGGGGGGGISPPAGRAAGRAGGDGDSAAAAKEKKKKKKKKKKEEEKEKQDSARGPSSPESAAAIGAPPPVSALTGGVDIERAVAEAGRERLKELRRKRKQDERVDRTTAELLKVLVPSSVAGTATASSATTGAAIGTLVPKTEAAVRLPCAEFCDAVDAAMHSTTSGRGSHLSGALYCRKLLAQWPAAAAAPPLFEPVPGEVAPPTVLVPPRAREQS